MADITGHIVEFENAEPLAGHEAHAAYLDNLLRLLERAALMVRMDAEIASTWLSRRRPKKGRRVPWAERRRICRRLRGHGRHVGDSLMEAVAQVHRWKLVHAEYVAQEKEAREKKESSGG